MVEFATIWTDKDAYVDQASPDLNFGSQSTLHVQSWAGIGGTGANQRTYVGFDLTQLALPEDIEDRILDAIVRFPVNQDSGEERTLELFEITPADWTEGGIDWNGQPTPGDSQGTESSDASANGLHAFSVQALFLQAHAEGRARLGFMLRDTQEGSSLAQQQDYDSREGGNSTMGEDEPELQIVYTSARVADLASSLEPRLTEHLPSHAQPRLAGVGDLDASITPQRFAVTGSLVEVQAIPIENTHEARAAGRVSIELGGALDDVEAILDEIGTLVHVDGQSTRAIVQLIDAFSKTLPAVGPGDPVRLAQGDAVLFAIGDGGTFTPGQRVTWQGVDWQVVGTLDEEQVTDEALFREVGLRRLATTHEARATGEVSTA